MKYIPQTFPKSSEKKGLRTLIRYICDKHFACCNYQYYSCDNDIEDDAAECGLLVKVEDVEYADCIEIDGIKKCSICKSDIPYVNNGCGVIYWKSKYCRICGAEFRNSPEV